MQVYVPINQAFEWQNKVQNIVLDSWDNKFCINLSIAVFCFTFDNSNVGFGRWQRRKFLEKSLKKCYLTQIQIIENLKKQLN